MLKPNGVLSRILSLLQELRVFRDPKQVAEMANREKGNTSCASLPALTPSERTHTEMHIKKFSPTKLWLFCTLFLAAILCSSGAQGAETVILPPHAARAQLRKARKALQNGFVVAMLDATPPAFACAA